MRPHVELVSEHDLIWHDAELPAGSGAARQRNLSYDEENGAASVRVQFDETWLRPAGYHHADTEWFAIAGQVRLGDQYLGAGGYWRSPAGLRVPPIEVSAGTEILLFRDHGTEEFTPSEFDRSGFVRRGGASPSWEPGELTVVDSTTLPWSGVATGGQRAKLLYAEPSDALVPGSGMHTHLREVPAGWREEIYRHSPAFEEGYCLSGTLRYNFGTLAAGAYYYRPPRVKHGDSTVGGPDPAVLLIRRGGDGADLLTRAPSVRSSGRAVNYDANAQAPVLAGIPVRTRSAGPWGEEYR